MVVIQRIVKHSENKYSILDAEGKWYSDLKSVPFEIGDEVTIEGNNAFSQDESNRIKAIRQFEKRFGKQVKELQDDIDFAVEEFRKRFDREPSGDEFSFINLIIMHLQKKRYFTKQSTSISTKIDEDEI